MTDLTSEESFIIRFYRFLWTKYLCSYSLSIEVTGLRDNKMFPAILDISWMVLIFSLYQLYKCLTKLEISWREIRWIWLIFQSSLSNMCLSICHARRLNLYCWEMLDTYSSDFWYLCSFLFRNTTQPWLFHQDTKNAIKVNTCYPSYKKATQLVLNIFKMCVWFLDGLRISCFKNNSDF